MPASVITAPALLADEGRRLERWIDSLETGK
jgi:hypothetical protein